MPPGPPSRFNAGPRALVAPADSGGSAEADLGTLFHRLNNQLGVILANAELLEARLSDNAHRARAGQVVSGALDAITTAKQIRKLLTSAS